MDIKNLGGRLVGPFLRPALAAAAAVALAFIVPQRASADFDVNWRPSLDNGMFGYEELGHWLVNNGYYNNFNDAKNFAQTGYIGFDNADPDAYYWDISGPIDARIVKEVAGFANKNTFGYYIGDQKTQVFGGPDGILTPPKSFSPADPFGLYLSTPQGNTFFTDRAKNVQAGNLFNAGGDPQALIYQLASNEWLVAWEDLDATWIGSDNDYNDMYIKLTVASEPIASSLFALGGGLMGWRLKRKSKAAKARTA
jgi:hypothetical protein